MKSDKSPAPQGPDFTNLDNCIEETINAVLDTETGPDDPEEFSGLIARVEACRKNLPPLYRRKVIKPFLTSMEQLGNEGFNKVLMNDPGKEGEAGLMMDIAQAILQHGERYERKPTASYQEVVSDIYDGFMSADDRRGIKLPDHDVVSPLVKWGRPDYGPYTWPVDVTSYFGAGAAVVNLPPAHAYRGLFAYAALGHETAGHDVLHADDGLRDELAAAVEAALTEKNLGANMAEYWASRIDESASDVLGILNMGPVVGISIIGYFRAMNAAYGFGRRLRNDGPEYDDHPADIVRGYLAASTVKLLKVRTAKKWSAAIEAETDRDVSTIRLAGEKVTEKDAKFSADVVAATIAKTKLRSLANHAFQEIQDWRDSDDEVVCELCPILASMGKLPTRYARGTYAAHVVVGAITLALKKDANIPVIFDRMQGILKIMHDANPSWGPLYIEHPGDLAPIRAYTPSTG